MHHPNNNMNAVDIFAQLMYNYSLDRRSKKLFYFFDATVSNAYILYKQLRKEITLETFEGQRACVKDLLLNRKTPTRGNI